MPTSRPLPRDPFDHPALSESVRALARRGVPRPYRKGTLLIQEGEFGDTIYVILAGRLRAFGSDIRSDREITYGSYGPGEYVGEMGLDGGPRSASVIAEEDSTCAMLTRRSLEAHLAENPEFAFELIAKLIRRARAATLSAKQLALNDVYGRLKSMLDAQAVDRGDNTRIVGRRMTHKEMARHLACTREMVSRVMTELQKGGYVEAGADGLVLRRALPARWSPT